MGDRPAEAARHHEGDEQPAGDAEDQDDDVPSPQGHRLGECDLHRDAGVQAPRRPLDRRAGVDTSDAVDSFPDQAHGLWRTLVIGDRAQILLRLAAAREHPSVRVVDRHDGSWRERGDGERLLEILNPHQEAHRGGDLASAVPKRVGKHHARFPSPTLTDRKHRGPDNTCPRGKHSCGPRPIGEFIEALAGVNHLLTGLPPSRQADHAWPLKQPLHHAERLARLGGTQEAHLEVPRQAVQGGDFTAQRFGKGDGRDPRLVVEVGQTFPIGREARPRHSHEQRDEQQQDEEEELAPEGLLPERFHQIGGPKVLQATQIIGSGQGLRHRPGQNPLHEVCNCRSGRRGGPRVPGRSSCESARNQAPARGRRE